MIGSNLDSPFRRTFPLPNPYAYLAINSFGRRFAVHLSRVLFDVFRRDSCAHIPSCVRIRREYLSFRGTYEDHARERKDTRGGKPLPEILHHTLFSLLTCVSELRRLVCEFHSGASTRKTKIDRIGRGSKGHRGFPLVQGCHDLRRSRR